MKKKIKIREQNWFALLLGSAIGFILAIPTYGLFLDMNLDSYQHSLKTLKQKQAFYSIEKEIIEGLRAERDEACFQLGRAVQEACSSFRKSEDVCKDPTFKKTFDWSEAKRNK